MITEILDADKKWYQQARFGLFIHWGLYSLAARHEWVRTYEEIPEKEYDRKYRDHFEPDLYNPEEWADAAEKAGMKYVVLTVKHHDGFCLWDSRFTDYNSCNSPADKDLLKPFLDAFRKRGIRVGLYYSLIDWHHPDFVIDQHHPLRNNPDALQKKRDQKKYSEYLYNQVEELLTDYGKIDILWFDFSYGDPDSPLDFSKGKGKEAWESEKLIAMVRRKQPHILLNDRHGLDKDDSWDFKTPEQFMPREWYRYKGEKTVWEACQTFSGSWGYFRDEHDWRSSRQILATLIQCVSSGGNLLMNIGPDGRGRIDDRALSRMDSIGKWMRLNGRSVYGCTAPPEKYSVPSNCMMTYNPERRSLYIHIFNWPYKHLHLDGQVFPKEAVYARFLHDGSEVQFKGLEEWQEHAALDAGFDPKKSLTLLLPQKEPDVLIPVIELFLE